MPEILIEHGARPFNYVDDTSLETQAATYVAITEKALTKFEGRVGIKTMPYEGLHGSQLSFHDPSHDRIGLPAKDLLSVAAVYNGYGIPFNLALNAGYDLDGQVGPEDFTQQGARFEKAMDVLKALTEIGERHGVQNFVTIYLDAIYEAVKDTLPELGTIASCTRYLGGHKDFLRGTDRLTEDARKFDHVVLLPQHSYPEVLPYVRQQIQKVIVLPWLGCNIGNLGRCRAHYAGLSRVGKDFVPAPVFTQNPSGDCNEAFLFKDKRRFGELARGGVRGFKLQRNVDFYSAIISDLVGKYMKACQA